VSFATKSPDRFPVSRDARARRGRQHRSGDTLNRLADRWSAFPHRGLPERRHRRERRTGRVGLRVGERVVGLAFHGSHANCASRIRSPPGRSRRARDRTGRLRARGLRDGHDGLFEFGRLVEGETVLIHAGAAAWDCGHPDGQTSRARVIATASSDERLERLRDSVSTTASTTGRRTSSPKSARSRITKVPTSSLIRGWREPAKESERAGVPRALRHLRQRGTRRVTKLDTSTLGSSNQSLIGYFLGRAVRGSRLTP